MTFISEYLEEIAAITCAIDCDAIKRCIDLLGDTRAHGGRVFVLGVGGSAANASHAVNDLRKLANIEAYAPTDNIAELSARTNDAGWATVFHEWLRTSRLNTDDLVMVLSVGGGNVERNVSPNLVSALVYAQEVGAKIIGIVGRDDGYTARVADCCIMVPAINIERITPHSESFQSILWHLFVSHPDLKVSSTTW